MKDKLPILFKATVSFAILAFIFTRIDLSQIATRLQYLSLPFIIFALLFYTGCQWLSCLRWQVVLKSAGYLIPIRYLLSSYFAGMFVSIFLPSSVGGDVYRVYRITKVIDAPETAFASVFLERFTGLAAVFALALVGIPPAIKIIGSWDIILLFLICAGIIWGGFLLIASPWLLNLSRPWLKKIRLGGLCDRLDKVQFIVIQYLKHRQSLGLAIAISFVIQLSIIFYQYLLAQQLKIPISYLELLVFTPISIVVTLMPISLGGLGIQEGLWAYLFTRIGLTAEQAVLLSLTFTILGWILALPGAIILLLDSKGLKTTKQ
ncbi:lysylphosphatidylglycerol synthase transmembrane domain-containing protein [Pseudanabaena minima]|uniref:lysylphosphatidylglycerol synthase transmembrane domain-containing protein n=1 Tax=Pseudanabaena minima TaxID=890415 RepID=UPI003DAA1EBF